MKRKTIERELRPKIAAEERERWRRKHVATREETDAAILKKLAVLKLRLERKDAEAAAGRDADEGSGG